MELWRKAADRVLGMAMVCSKPHPDAEANLTRRATTIAQARERGVGAIFDGMAQTLVGATARAQRPEIVAELRTRMTLTAEALVAVQAGLATRPDSVPDVATIEAPVLVIAGGEDSGVSPAEMAAFHAAPGDASSPATRCRHFAAYEQPQKVAALLADWLGRCEA